jgi:hypothetical protein
MGIKALYMSSSQCISINGELNAQNISSALKGLSTESLTE